LGEGIHKPPSGLGRDSALLNEIGQFDEADRGDEDGAPAADTSSKAFAAAADNLGLLVRYQTAA